jgi:hypothetical protein
MSNYRFFYAPAAYRTWPKLFVLTPDGTLYSEYLDYMRPTTFERNVDFDTFKAEDFQWGGYQSMREVSYEQARSVGLTQQANWIDSYLKRI